MKKHIVAIIILLTSIFQSEIFCQNGKAKIIFNTTEFDLGEIDESQGKVSYEYVFSNDGNLPLVLNSVQPSCGCTTPEWTKEPVAPGKLGSINVKFDPKGRPGPFTKSITVNSNAETGTVVLKIKGYVKGVNMSLSEYKYTIGDLKLQNTHASFGQVIKGNVQKKSILVANGSSDAPIIISFKNIPAYISVSVEPVLLKPGESGSIQVEFNSNKLDDWDYVVDRLELIVNNNKLPDNIFTVSAVVKEDFSKLTAEDLAKAPKISFTTDKINFGTIQHNQKVEYEYTLVNNGATDLIIRKIRASCGCTVVQPAKNIIPPEQSTSIKTIFDSSGKSGEQKYAITVISNDPKNYKKLLWLEGYVVKD